MHATDERRSVARREALEERAHSRPASMMLLRNARVRGSLRIAEELARRALLEDHAGVEEADLGRDLAREVHLVRRDDHRHADLR